MSSRKPVVGRKYALHHCRFGRATVEVLRVDREWADIKIVSGVLIGMRHRWETGDENTVRLTHCDFESLKP